MKERKFFMVKMFFMALLFAMWGLAPAVTAGNNKPRFGGTLKASTRTIKTLDPIFSSSGDTRIIARHIYDFLFAWDEQGEVHPMMVEKWKASKDLKNYSFTLRKGLLFHNNKPVTSEDRDCFLAAVGKERSMGGDIFSGVC